MTAGKWYAEFRLDDWVAILIQMLELLSLKKNLQIFLRQPK